MTDRRVYKGIACNDVALVDFNVDITVRNIFGDGATGVGTFRTPLFRVPS